MIHFLAYIINKEFISVFPNKDFDKKNTINSSQLLINVKAEESDFIEPKPKEFMEFLLSVLIFVILSTVSKAMAYIFLYDFINKKPIELQRMFNQGCFEQEYG